MKEKNSFTIGQGLIGVQTGRIITEENKTKPFITLYHLPKKENVGEDLGINYEFEDKIVQLTFDNLEGLEVIEKALSYCREEIEKHL